jgi:hypothetical protein
MKRIQFSIAYPERLRHPLHRRLVEVESVTRAEILMWSPTGNATALLRCDGGRAATERLIGAIDSLLVSHLVAGSSGTYAFLRQEEYEFPTELLDAITAARVIFLPPVVLRASGPVEFEAVGEPPALSAFHERLSAVGDPTIEQVREFDRSPSAARLTDRQQAAVAVAVSVGYYDVPRTGSIADVAAELDCSTSTAGELVRKAESRIVRDAVGT